MYFDELYEKLLKHESGYNNYPQDKGGETICGIARNYNKFENKVWDIVDANKEAMGGLDTTKSIALQKKDWQVLSKMCFSNKAFQEAVKDFVYRRYYSKYKIYRINSKAKQGFVLDFCYNSFYAIREIQKMLNIKADNIIGDKTLKEINALDDKTFILKACDVREAYYKRQVELKPSNKIFEKGWLARVNSFRKDYV